jgi:hypothetical protein
MIRTVKGSEVQMLTTEAPTDRPWVGFVSDGFGGWNLYTWFSNGKYHRNGPCALDLVFHEDSISQS